MFIIRKSSLMIALIVVLSLALVACGGQAGTEPAAEQAQPTAAAPTDAPAEEPADAPAEEPAGPETITVTHAQGETEVVRNPQNVVIFDYGYLDTLTELGVNVAGVPHSNLPEFLSQYADVANVGTLFEPDFEVVNSLNPELIIVAGRSATVYPDLAKIAPTIDLTVPADDFINGFKANTLILGRIFGQEAEVEARLAEIDESIARVNGLATESGAKALIVMVSGGEITAYGPGSRFGLIHDELGVAPSVEDIEAATHGDAISFEFILEHNPDILFVLDRDSAVGQSGEAAGQVMDNELVHATNAWQNDKLVYMEPTAWYLANTGLNTVAQMIAQVEGAFATP